MSPGCSSQPRRKEALDLDGVVRLLEPALDLVSVDHEQRRRHRDPQPFHEVGAFAHLDAVHHERVVVPTPLQDLGDEALDSACLTVVRVVENQQPRLRNRLLHFGGYPPPCPSAASQPPPTSKEAGAGPRTTDTSVIARLPAIR